MKEYFCLVAGLPDIQHDDHKLSFSLKEFKEELRENLTPQDFALIELYFRKFDNQNLLTYFNDVDAELNELGNLSSKDLEEIIQLISEEDEPRDPRIPDYFKTFIPAYVDENPIVPGVSWEDQLNSLYYDSSLKCKNEFVRQWFEFNLNINNLLAAITCRKYDMPVGESIIGNTVIANSIRTSNAKDFGIAPIFPHLDAIFRIADETDLMEREKKIDLLKWQWLEEEAFFHYFTVEKIFAYLIKLSIIERWVTLSKETGEEIFREMIQTLKQSFEFPEEFTLNK